MPFRDLKTFLQDAVKLKGFTHDHVQRLLAITVSNNLPQAVVPSSEYGDLKSFLYKQRQRQEGEEVGHTLCYIKKITKVLRIKQSI